MLKELERMRHYIDGFSLLISTVMFKYSLLTLILTYYYYLNVAFIMQCVICIPVRPPLPEPVI